MKKIIALMIIMLSLSLPVFADTGGIIRGHIKMNGQAVIGAEIVLISEDLDTYTTKSNEKGEYFFSGLPYGQYLITVSIDGKFYVDYIIKK